MRHGLDGLQEEDDDVGLDEDSVTDGDPTRDQSRPPVLVRLLLALAGTGVLKLLSGFSGLTWLSDRVLGCNGIAPAGNAAECSEKESSTK